MRNLLFLLVLFSGFNVMNAQQDSLQREILDYPGTKSQIISSGRNLLRDRFLEGDLEKVKEIRNYLMNEVQNEDYLALYPGEYWLLLYWTGEYEELLESIMTFDDAAMKKLQHQIHPPYDMLFSKLQERTGSRKKEVENDLLAGDLQATEEDFLLLYLEYLLADSEDAHREQARINNLADTFLTKHPNSTYENYVRENLRFRYVRTKWGLAFEFFSGYGLLTGELSEEFQNSIPMGIAFDVEYNDFTLYLRNYIGFSFTKKERPYNGGVWEEDSQVRVYLPEASLGYAVIDNSRIKLSPFAGIASTSISPTEVDIDREPDVEEAGLDFTTTYMAGLNLDFKLKWDTGLLTPDESQHSYWFIRVRYGYSAPQFGAGNSGNMHYLTVGLGGLYRGAKRQL